MSSRPRGLAGALAFVCILASIGCVAGTNRFRDGKYVENVEYHWMEELSGQTVVFDHRFEDGNWSHSAEFEAGARRFQIDEVWERIPESNDER